MTEPPIRVLIADDHPVVRSGLAALLGTLDGIEVAGAVADGAGAVRESLLLRPDVVVLDLRMPGMDGFEAARRIVAGVPEVAVLVLSMVDDDALIAEALAAGARGYLVKGAEPDEIEAAVRAVARGSAVFSSAIAQRMLTGVARSRATDAFPILTVREREVLRLIALGEGNAEIAGTLGIAAKTVGNHISAIFLKVGVSTRAQAIARARDAGLER